MSFYKRSFHSFHGQTNAKTMPFKDDETSQPPRQPFESGLGLKTLSTHDKIIWSGETRDPGGIGFVEEAHGLTLCTEYLGFESYDMRMSDNEVEDKMTCHAEAETERVERKRRKTKGNVVAPQEQKKKFPPPLSSLNGRGQPSFYLRPVRKDGRLELTRVMIHRPEIFQASRENGRLRLHLVNAYCDPKETVDVEDEPKDLDLPLKENDGGNVSKSNLKSGKEINEDNDHAASDQVADLSMINNDGGATSSHEVSLNCDDDDDDDDDAHFHDEDDDAREWRYESCCKIVATRNHDENDYHHHHQIHHPYHHHNSNDNLHLWSRAYVKTR